MIYTGIGSRDTPKDTLYLMYDIAKFFSSLEWTLRSGGARGADSAFESGASKKRIYLPWEGFEGKYSDQYEYVVPEPNEYLARLYHRKYSELSPKAKLLMSRNSYQVLGDDLQSPSNILFCYTLGGMPTGGTRQAIMIAKDYSVPVINLYYISKKDHKVFDELGLPDLKLLLPIAN